jgi:hypothetical protein
MCVCVTYQDSFQEMMLQTVCYRHRDYGGYVPPPLAEADQPPAESITTEPARKLYRGMLPSCSRNVCLASVSGGILLHVCGLTLSSWP